MDNETYFIYEDYRIILPLLILHGLYTHEDWTMIKAMYFKHRMHWLSIKDYV